MSVRKWQTLKLAILGARNVGKSILVDTVVQLEPAVWGATMRKEVVVDGKVVLLVIFNPAGQEDYRALESHWIRENKCFLLVYDFRSRETFDKVRAYLDVILKTKELDRGTIPIVLVGNNIDVDRGGSREVEVEEGQSLAKDWSCPFFEFSRKDNHQKCFFELVRETRRMDDMMMPKLHKAFLKAAKANDVNAMQKMLDAGANIDITGSTGLGFRSTT